MTKCPLSGGRSAPASAGAAASDRDDRAILVLTPLCDRLPASSLIATGYSLLANQEGLMRYRVSRRRGSAYGAGCFGQGGGDVLDCLTRCSGEHLAPPALFTTCGTALGEVYCLQLRSTRKRARPRHQALLRRSRIERCFSPGLWSIGSWTQVAKPAGFVELGKQLWLVWAAVLHGCRGGGISLDVGRRDVIILLSRQWLNRKRTFAVSTLF